MNEQRTFKIINLTSLDSEESQDIVSILNDVMNSRNMESGRKGVEYIIRDYKRKMDNFQTERKELKGEIEQLKKEKFEQYDLLKKHVAVSTSLKELNFNLGLV
jgi:seryl-tRNA synthetase